MSNELLSANERVVLVGMARMIEQREDATGLHIDRIQAYSLRIARAVAASCHSDLAAQITTEFLGDLADAACLHDIGKACIPDAVLLKPGQLSEEELGIIRGHSIRGAQVFEQSRTTLFERMAYDIIRSHHEKWDGSGYPDRLAGEAIPLSARIVAIADAYDALTTWRCYKAASTPEHACEIIKSASGTHFDPRLSEIFLTVSSEIAMHS